MVIRMQRTGRSGHAQFRVIAQDRRFSPVSGRVAAYLGSYDPHTKAVNLDSDKIVAYIANGAQPSDRVVKLLKKEGIKFPKWVAEQLKKQKPVRNPDKRRSTRPEGVPEPAKKAVEASTEETVESSEAEAPVEKTSDESAEASAEEAPPVEPEAQGEAPVEVEPEAKKSAE